MNGRDKIRAGMQVYGPEGQLLGTVEGRSRIGLLVDGQAYASDAITRVTGNRVYLYLGAARLRQQREQSAERTRWARAVR